MKVLLDTCAFLWLAEGSARLSKRLQELYADPDVELYLSVISAWEIITKHGHGKLPLSSDAAIFVRSRRERLGIESLALTEDAIANLERLPPLHTDPFDRALVCQAIAEGMALATPDPDITQYPVRVVW